MGRYQRTVNEKLLNASPEIREIFQELKGLALSFGSDVQIIETVSYFAFHRRKIFAYVKVRPRAGKLLVNVKVNPDKVLLVDGFTRDMRPGLAGGKRYSAPLQITIKSIHDLEKAKPFLLLSYNNN